MDSSSQRASSLPDEFHVSLQMQPQGTQGDIEEAVEHIHMPNASYWPLFVGVAVSITMFGLLFVSYFPWISLAGVVLVLITIMGWALEDPFAQLKDKFIAVVADHWKYQLGQNVVDAQGKWLGQVKARFTRYILVERGRLLPKVFYVPQSAIKDNVRNNTLFLTLTEEDLIRRELNTIPDDLYDVDQVVGKTSVSGVPQFAHRPLSPAETGHYNYGRMSPGINTDASGSYHRNEVQPRPADYVVDDTYTTDVPIPARPTNPE